MLAHRDSFGYIAGKVLRRNRITVVAATLVILSASAGYYIIPVGGLLYYSIWHEKQRAQCRYADVRQLASTFLFDIENQLHDLPGATKAREMVVSTALIPQPSFP